MSRRVSDAPGWTPGPWRVANYDQPVTVCGQQIPCFEIESDADACWIAKVQNHQDCVDTPEGSANARLIAAAPDLYTAVEAALNMVDGDGAPPDWDMLRAALAKARGEKPNAR